MVVDILHPERLRVAAVVTFYMASALVMVFVNKAVLNSSPDLPLIFLLFQLLIAVLLLHLSAAISKKIQIPKLDLQVAKSLFPVVSVNIIGLVFNTLCLRDVDASFFQIARGLVLPLTIAVSSVFSKSTPSGNVLIAAGIVTSGFMWGVAPSSHSVPAASIPSTLSLFYGVLSSLFIAFHAVLIKSSLPYCNNSTIELAWWTNVGSAILILPFVLLRQEPSKLIELAQSNTWDWSVFFSGSLVTGVFGFLLCVAGLLSIKVTSPITHMFSSAARSILQTVLSIRFFGDILTVNRAASIGIILAGTMFYTWAKSVESLPLPSQRNPDVELGTKSRLEHAVSGQVTDEKDVRN
jgi:solute carrier family 35 (GDP-fucose transporter), member C1